MRTAYYGALAFGCDGSDELPGPTAAAWEVEGDADAYSVSSMQGTTYVCNNVNRITGMWRGEATKVAQPSVHASRGGCAKEHTHLKFD